MGAERRTRAFALNEVGAQVSHDGERVFQTEGTASAKTLRQDSAWPVRETARRPLM